MVDRRMAGAQYKRYGEIVEIGSFSPIYCPVQYFF
jgi:hypothetical protein